MYNDEYMESVQSATSGEYPNEPETLAALVDRLYVQEDLLFFEFFNKIIKDRNNGKT